MINASGQVTALKSARRHSPGVYLRTFLVVVTFLIIAKTMWLAVPGTVGEWENTYLLTRGGVEYAVVTWLIPRRPRDRGSLRLRDFDWLLD